MRRNSFRFLLSSTLPVLRKFSGHKGFKVAELLTWWHFFQKLIDSFTAAQYYCLSSHLNTALQQNWSTFLVFWKSLYKLQFHISSLKSTEIKWTYIFFSLSNMRSSSSTNATLQTRFNLMSSFSQKGHLANTMEFYILAGLQFVQLCTSVNE